MCKKCPVEAIIGEKKQARILFRTDVLGGGMCIDSCKFERITVS